MFKSDLFTCRQQVHVPEMVDTCDIYIYMHACMITEKCTMSVQDPPCWLKWDRSCRHLRKHPDNLPFHNFADDFLTVFLHAEMSIAISCQPNVTYS